LFYLKEKRGFGYLNKKAQGAFLPNTPWAFLCFDGRLSPVKEI